MLEFSLLTMANGLGGWELLPASLNVAVPGCLAACTSRSGSGVFLYNWLLLETYLYNECHDAVALKNVYCNT